MTDVDPDETVHIISYGNSAKVAHTDADCLSIKKADDGKARAVERRKHPNVRLCKHCTDPIDKEQLEYSNLANEIQGLWADD